ncbi:BTB and MATH domain-containing 36-like [Paramuricea clavata]|uniref:BTB and MATH domain-containing 36-like n=1 Tax=Paramuricea clavata TaxID=317549 RepID=A0A6S7GUL2_PARCT|nr:BTB and MATH domain-containing 36-like [Paramuricea clavata]
MATKNDKNVFASPWNDSDMVLVLEGRELHVHKWILKSQSPVFKAMFDGHFQEASEARITLKEKYFQSMVRFLKVLYPSSMFGETKSPLDDECWLSILALAEEYQCVNVIKQCIDEVKITPQNALQILPYAVKYHHTALPTIYDVINWSAPTTKLEKIVPEIESKEKSNTMLLTKCRFLESAVVKMQDAIISLIDDFVTQKKSADDALSSTQKSLDEATRKINDLQPPAAKNVIMSLAHVGAKHKGRHSTPIGYSSAYAAMPKQTYHGASNTTADYRCSHNVGVREISKTKSCIHCKEKYKEKFLVPIPSCQNTQNIFSMLQSGDDVATAVKNQI